MTERRPAQWPDIDERIDAHLRAEMAKACDRVLDTGTPGHHCARDCPCLDDDDLHTEKLSLMFWSPAGKTAVVTIDEGKIVLLRPMPLLNEDDDRLEVSVEDQGIRREAVCAEQSAELLGWTVRRLDRDNE